MVHACGTREPWDFGPRPVTDGTSPSRVMRGARSGDTRVGPADGPDELGRRTGATVAILLATYNGGRYLEQQLTSILMQTYSGWHILARDDGSCDNTVEILESFAQRYPGRLRLVKDELGHLGARGNFGRLLEEADADYIAFCDQDDVWHPHRIELGLARVRELEEIRGRHSPILVFSDVMVVDEHLRVVAPSFWTYARLTPLKARWRDLLTDSPAAGCTFLFNRALRDAVVPIPEEAVLHDRWVVLVASLLGYVDAMPVATVMYRQHTANSVGARPNSLWYVLARLPRLWRRDAFVKHLAGSQRQARAIVRRYGSRLAPEVRAVLAGYASLDSMGFLSRRMFLLRHRIFRQGWVRTIAFLVRV